MACRFLDSVQHYQTAHLAEKYNVVGANVIVHPSDGYSGNQCLKSTNGGAGNSLTKTIDQQTTWIIGFRYFTGTLPGGAGDFINFDHSAGGNQCSFSLNPGGTISAWRGDWDFGGVHLGTSGVVSLQNNTWYYLEFKTVIDDAAGVMAITINGTPVLTLSGQDTHATGGGFVGGDSIRLSLSSTNGTARLQDLHIFDGTGGVNDDMIGEYSVECLYPKDVGNSSAWTPSGGAVDNYTMVNEKTFAFPDDDTTYNAAAAAAKDTYEMDDLSFATGLVAAVQVVSSNRKDDVGAVNVENVVRSNAGDFNGPTFGLGDDYIFTCDQWDTDPGFATAWTITHVNAMEAGIERI